MSKGASKRQRRGKNAGFFIAAIVLGGLTAVPIVLVGLRIIDFMCR